MLIKKPRLGANMFEIPSEEINDLKPYVYHTDNKSFSAKNAVKVKGIIKKPSKETKPKTYNELARSRKDEQLITELISGIGNKTKTSLLFDTRHMTEVGDQVRHVHPYKFFGYIFSKHDLKDAMCNILDDYWKKSTFISRMTPSLNNEHLTGSLKTYIKDFCNEISVNGIQVHPYQIEPYINTRDWEGLLFFLSAQ